MELFKLFLGDISFLEKMCTLSFGGSSKGTKPPKTWTGFKVADLEKLRGMAGSLAGLAGGTNLEKIRPKMATLGEKITTSKRQAFSLERGYYTSVTRHHHNKPTEELVGKEEGGDEVQRLMGLFRKRQQEVVRGTAAPGRKALRAEGTGDY
mgnify:CR=1 FL=1